ncbi:hypothetical protein L6452_21923 [Arctium lappa]|uniref:Uncharacterized protein n=1 Tax=Arctium lappa TaxID=4217 RepID=A0ACB9AZA3_ARCLA|nr:hypothetical protein L6452_21923 [Arctium lappa]
MFAATVPPYRRCREPIGAVVSGVTAANRGPGFCCCCVPPRFSVRSQKSPVLLYVRSTRRCLELMRAFVQTNLGVVVCAFFAGRLRGLKVDAGVYASRLCVLVV